MDALYAHARVDDLDLDAISQWVSKGKKIAFSATKQATSIKLATKVGHFCDLDLDCKCFKYGLSNLFTILVFWETFGSLYLGKAAAAA